MTDRPTCSAECLKSYCDNTLRSWTADDAAVDVAGTSTFTGIGTPACVAMTLRAQYYGSRKGGAGKGKGGDKGGAGKGKGGDKGGKEGGDKGGNDGRGKGHTSR
jgi:hypothetical protein